jgi:hypothetical protein
VGDLDGRATLALFLRALLQLAHEMLDVDDRVVWFHEVCCQP